MIAENKNDKKHTLSVFLDVKKAYDCVSHDIFLKKLQLYGIKGVAHQWFKSFLTNRRQMVLINEVKSDPLQLIRGIPQGSCLGSLCFLIHINDLQHATEMQAILFADDTTLNHCDGDIANLYRKANVELDKVSQWFLANELALHPSKTKYIFFLPPKGKEITDEIKLMGKEVSRISETNEEKSFKYVGVKLDENITFKYHTKMVHEKAIRNIMIINNAKKSLTQNVKKMLYIAIIKPYFDFSAAMWANASLKFIRSLTICQKKILRIIYGKPFRYHTEELFKSSRIMKLKEIVAFNQAKLAHSIWYKNAPKSTLNTLSKNH